MAKQTKTEYRCSICGEYLTEQNSRSNSATCIDCESDYFKSIEATNGTHLAIWICCGAFNLPCEPTIIPNDIMAFKGDKWREYIRLLTESGKLTNEDGSPRTFFDGETYLLRIFGKNFSEKDFARYCETEKARIESLVGTEAQRDRWGETWDDIDDDGEYTAEDYKELDRQYYNRVASYNGVTLTPQMESTLIDVVSWRFKMDKYIKRGDIKSAKDIQSMIDTALASESMRKKDEKPVEAMRIDAMVTALEEAGLMEKGDLLPYDKLVEALRDKFIKSKKYDYSLDVCDQVIFDTYNTMRQNADLATVTDLPDDLEVEDEYGEFEKEETEKEKENKRYAGLTKVTFEKESK